MKRYFSIAMLACSFMHSTLAIGLGREELDETRFVELMKTVVPTEDSSLVRWVPDLLEGQRLALEQKKPMFIWSMDGHPLGCT